MKRAQIILGCLLAAAISHASTFYVAVNGSPTNTGSINSPWDLFTALSHPQSVQAGDTILLRDGVYKGKYVSALNGSAALPITLMSHPGEWAAIDGLQDNFLLGPISASDNQLTVTDASLITLSSNVIKIDDEDIYMSAKNGNTLTVVRGWGGTTPANHNAGARVYHRANVFTVNGSYTNYMNFEIMNSDTARITTTAGSSPPNITRGDGLSIFGPNTKFINLVIHDNANGIGYWTAAANSEVIGCIVYHNGWQGPDRGHGHGLYIQNENGYKLVKNVISFNNHSTGMKGFGQAGYANNIIFDQVTSFNNGSIHNQTLETHTQNILVGTDQQPITKTTIMNCALYHNLGVVGSNLILGYSVDGNDTAIVKNNYLAGGNNALAVSKWKTGEVTGNHLYISTGVVQNGNSGMASYVLPQGVTSPNFIWNNNEYVDDSPFTGYTFTYTGATNNLGGGLLKFDETPTQLGKGWRQWTGWDSASTFRLGIDTGVKVIIYKDDFEQGRGNIVVYNWDSLPAVSVDVSSLGLSNGDLYEVMDVQNYFGTPVASGTYSGSNITIPMLHTTISPTSGTVYTPPVHTGIEFGVYVVRKKDVTAAITYQEEKPLSVWSTIQQGKLSVIASSQMNEIWLYDLTGRKMLYEATAGASTSTIDISNLSPSVYILQVRCGNAIATQKIIYAR